MILNLDHIAFLVPSLSLAVTGLPAWIQLDDTEEHASEGTREQYAHLPDKHAPSLLFLEPIAEGPYSRAMSKRGAGLHHFGFSTDSVDSTIDHFASCGLLLHPISRYTYKHNAAWMCRPGVPFLVEIYTPPATQQAKPDLIQLEIPLQQGCDISAINWIPSVELQATNKAEVGLLVAGQRITINLGAKQGPHPATPGTG